MCQDNYAFVSVVMKDNDTRYCPKKNNCETEIWTINVRENSKWSKSIRFIKEKRRIVSHGKVQWVSNIKWNIKNESENKRTFQGVRTTDTFEKYLIKFTKKFNLPVKWLRLWAPYVKIFSNLPINWNAYMKKQLEKKMIWITVNL